MGGNAFAPDGLCTPRMPTVVYRHVMQDVLAKLKTVYVRAEAPLEAPGKNDHGDVDILVVAEVKPDSKHVAQVLGAIKFKEVSGSGTVNYAVPWPEYLWRYSDAAVLDSESEVHAQADKSANRSLHNNSSRNDSNLNTSLHLKSPERKQQIQFIQVDVNHNKDDDEFVFTKFLHAHRDMWLMIGTMIRPYGLTCTDGGLYIRIPELEAWDKKRSRVKLIDCCRHCHHPNEILKYLHLNVDSFWQPFTTVEDCMDYVTTCRFYNPAKGTARHEDGAAHADIKVEEKKHKQRPMFAYWLDVYLPSHRHVPSGKSVNMTREDVVMEAKQIFGIEFAQRYDRAKATGLREQAVMAMWADVRKCIPAQGGAVLGYAMKGLKARVGNPVPDIIPFDGEDDDDEAEEALRSAQDAFRDGHFDVVKQWCLANWEVVASRQENADKAKTQRILREKFEK